MTTAIAAGVLIATGSLTGAPAAEADASLRLWYPLDQQSGTVVADASGNGRDGTVVGAASWSSGALRFSGQGGYVKMPDDLLTGMSAITVSAMVWIDPTQTTPYFLYNLGNTAGTDPALNGQIFQSGNAYRGTISATNWSAEKTVAQSPAGNLPRGTWVHIAYSINGNTQTLFRDGAVVGSAQTTGTPAPGSLGGGRTTANFLGRSAYATDKFFSGQMRDFRLYDRALSTQEIAELASAGSRSLVRADLDGLDLGDTSAVTADLVLPRTGTQGTALTWSTDAAAVVAADGTVTRPAPGSPPATATLTVTGARGVVNETRSIPVTVLADVDDATKADNALDAIAIHNIDDVRGNLTLTRQSAGVAVKWASSRPDVITPTGEVTRPATASEPVTVTLTATVSVGAYTASRELVATVPALPAEEPLEAYLFSYFEGSPVDERIFFAASEGNDALRWNELNNGEPILESTLGTGGLRDPFITRSPEGDRFYMIATDLSIAKTTWGEAVKHGSSSIEVWESTDLVHWGQQRHVTVSEDNYGMTWAPEAYWDETIGAYVVYWASNVYTSTDKSDRQDAQILYATTRDFVTFSDPQPWFVSVGAPGFTYGVIDSTVLRENDAWYRFTKATYQGCADIVQQKSTTLRATQASGSWAVQDSCIARDTGTGDVEGPLVFKANPGDVNGAGYYLFADEHAGRGYLPFHTDDLDTPSWNQITEHGLPDAPRHGTVLPITVTEYERVLDAFQPELLIESVDRVEVTTIEGTHPVLPESVSVRYANGTTGVAPVRWDEIAADAYALPKAFTVIGRVDGSSRPAHANIEVTAAPLPAPSLTLDTRCVAGRVVLTATVLNESAVPITGTIVTAYGNRSIEMLARGSARSYAFSSRLTAVPDGTVVASSTSSTGKRLPVVSGTYSARHCG